MKRLLFLIPLLCAVQMFGQTNINDPLIGTSINPSLWSLEVIPSGFGGSITPSNLGLIITSGQGFGGRGIVSACSLRGDFDVQVDFQVTGTGLNWLPNNLHTVRL